MLKQTLVTEREKPPVASENNMIENFYPQHVGRFLESPGDFDVFLAGRRLSAGVIVNENYGSRAQVKSCAPDFPRMN